MPDLLCQHCGKSFWNKGRRNKFCSFACATEHRRTERPRCIRCGEPVTLGRNVYCSKTCSNAARWDAGVYGERGETRSYRERYEADRDKHLARAAARYSVPLGPACESCGGTDDLHRHHDDYSKPLDVRTLCRTCHYREHPAAAEGVKRRAAARRAA
jgi:hypothetical protein